MSILSGLKSMFGFSGKKNPEVFAGGSLPSFNRSRPDPYAIIGSGYDAASPSRFIDKAYAGLATGQFDIIADKGTRKTLRDVARAEVRNNCNATGVIRTLVNDTVGTGPKLNVHTDDTDLNFEIENRFKKWVSACGLVEKIQDMRKSRIESGDVFAMAITNPKLDNAVKLDYQVLESEYVSSDAFNDYKLPGFNGSPLIGQDGVLTDTAQNVDGVLLDRLNNITGFVVNVEGKKKTISSEYMLQYTRHDRPMQHRAVPEITPALPLFTIHRRYGMAVLIAAETAADFAVLIQAQARAEDTITRADEFDIMDVEKGAMMTLPYGYGAFQLKAEQPTTTYSDFNKEIVHQYAMIFNMPFIIAYGDASSANYSSGRLDFQRYVKAIKVEQHRIEEKILKPVFRSWFNEARLIYPKLRPIRSIHDLDYSWYWDGYDHVDPKKETSAIKDLYDMDFITAKDYWASRGKDWEKQAMQKKREKDFYAKLGLTAEEALS